MRSPLSSFCLGSLLAASLVHCSRSSPIPPNPLQTSTGELPAAHDAPAEPPSPLPPLAPVTGGVAGGAGPSRSRTPPTPVGTAYYVAPSGTGTACKRAAPCRQISETIRRLRPGDVVFVADGTYAPFALEDITGSASAPITIYAQGLAANVSPGLQDSISITNSFHIVIDGLSASAAGRAGVRILCSDHVTIRNGRFTGSTKWGIFSGFAGDLTVEHNETSGSRRQHGIYASNSADRPVLRGNVVHDNVSAGIQINADGSESPDANCAWLTAGGVVDGITTGAVIDGNVIYANGKTGAAGINLCGVQSSVVRNNILYDNHATGIVNYQGDGNAGPKGMQILGNTVVQAPGARHALQFLDTTGKNVVRDNILYHPDARKAGLEIGSAADLPNVDSDYNMVDRFDLDDHILPLEAFRETYKREQHSISGPAPAQLFAAVASGDLSLAPGSPAIGKGVFVADAPVDQLGKARPAASPDIGALQR